MAWEVSQLRLPGLNGTLRLAMLLALVLPYEPTS